MTIGHRRYLGLSMEANAILAAEVALHRGGVELLRAGEFVMPDKPSASDAQVVGRAFGDFLKQQGFGAHHAVVGLPARWLLTAEKELPRAGNESMSAMVKLEAEQRFASDLDHLRIDYLADSGASGVAAPVFIAAVARDKVQWVLAMVQAAGLKPKAVTPTSSALSAAAPALQKDSIIVALQPKYAEAIVRSNGRCLSVRHLDLPAAEKDGNDSGYGSLGKSLGGALRRLISALAVSGSGPTSVELAIADGMGCSTQSAKAIEDALDWAGPLQWIRSNDFGIVPGSAPAVADSERYMGAAVVGALGLRQMGESIDFSNPRTEWHVRKWNLRRTVWVAAAAVVVVTALVAYGLDWRQRERELAAAQQSLRAMKPQIDRAEAFVSRATLARQWTDRRPRYLEPLRELTLAVPVDAPIWVTNVAMREALSEAERAAAPASAALRNDLRLVIRGMATNEQTVLSVLDSIRAREPFADAGLREMTQTGGTARGVSFTIMFDYRDKD